MDGGEGTGLLSDPLILNIAGAVTSSFFSYAMMTSSSFHMLWWRHYSSHNLWIDTYPVMSCPALLRYVLFYPTHFVSSFLYLPPYILNNDLTVLTLSPTTSFFTQLFIILYQPHSVAPQLRYFYGGAYKEEYLLYLNLLKLKELKKIVKSLTLN